jgi:hypothetical protein
MNATAALTARPPRAAIAWTTSGAIFVEIPCREGPPYICRYPCTTEGLVSALNILIENPEAAPRSIPADHPTIKRSKLVVSEAEREGVRSTLRKMGIT